MPSETTLSQSINFFRQGVSVRTPRQLFGSSLAPKIFSSKPFRYIASGSSYSYTIFDDEIAGVGPGRLGGKNTVTQIFYDLEKSNYGQPSEFVEGVPFKDIDSQYVSGGAGATFLGEVDSFYKESRYPNVLFNKTLKNPAQMDGVIEPLTIRREIEFSALEGSDVFHKIRGALVGDVDLTFRGSTPILQQVAFSPRRIEPYLDAPEIFGSSSDGMISLPGLVMEASSSATTPFVDTSIEIFQMQGLPTGSGHDSDNTVIRDAVGVMTSSTDSMFIDGYRSTGAGFTYTNQNKYGTDSITFGGLNKLERAPIQVIPQKYGGYEGGVLLPAVPHGIGATYNLLDSFAGSRSPRSVYTSTAAGLLAMWLQVTPGGDAAEGTSGPTSLAPWVNARGQMPALYQWAGSDITPPQHTKKILTKGDFARDTVILGDHISSYSWSIRAGGGGDAGSGFPQKYLSPSSVGNNGTPTSSSDLEFSASIWINFEDLRGSLENIFFKAATHDGSTVWEWHLKHGTDNKFLFGLGDGENSWAKQSIASAVALTGAESEALTNSWHHYVITYDGSGGSSAYAGLKIYIDGELHTTVVEDNDSGYVGVKPDWDQPLWIGANQGGAVELEGEVAEIAYWWNHELAEGEVRAIYNRTRYARQTSGYINNPTRLLLQDRDNALGRYPTIARTGDPDFLGKFPVHFDDTETLIFSASNYADSLIYPGLLNFKRSELGSDPIVATPRMNPITLTRAMVAGVSDDLIDINQNNVPGQTLTPFNETRIHASSSNGLRAQEIKFYATGTGVDILPGFTSPLRDKTIIVVTGSFSPLPEDPTGTYSRKAGTFDVFFSTGNLANTTYADSDVGWQKGVNSGIAYFSWAKSQWEPVGDFTTGSNIDYMNKQMHIVTASCLATYPAAYPSVATPVSSLQQKDTTGLPVNTCGFPWGRKFNATGSQLLDMSQFLTHPFLLEKVSIEISGAFGGPGFGHASGDAGTADPYREVATTTFMLLRQTDVALTSSYPPSLETGLSTVSTTFRCYRYPGAGGGGAMQDLNAFYSASNPRDIVWFGRVASYRPQATYGFSGGESELSSSYSAFWKGSDLWLEEGLGPRAFTGSIRLEAPCRVGATAASYGNAFLPRRKWSDPTFQYNWDLMFFGNPLGGSSLFGLPDGRRYVGATVGGAVIGTAAAVNAGNILMPVVDPIQRVSPYVLMPNDKLVLAVVKQLYDGAGAESKSNDLTTEDQIQNKYSLRLAPYPFKVTLFGSLIKDSQEYHETLNQPLTSNAIHEALHSDNPVVDQFDVEMPAAYARTFSDEVYSGSMTDVKASSIADSIAGHMRGVVGRTSEGTQGSTGSLKRTFRSIEKSNFYYDSLIPNPVKAYESLGGKNIRIKGNNTMLLGFLSQSATAGTNTYDDYVAWDFIPKAATPFDSFADIDRILLNKATPNMFQTAFSAVTGTAPGANQLMSAIAVTGTSMLRAGTKVRGIPAMLTEGGTVKNCDPSTFARVLFGRGDGLRNSIFSKPLEVAGSTDFYDNSKEMPLRGYGYGLKNVTPTSPSIVSRRDKYGQLRDMLEQRKDSRFFNHEVDGGNLSDAPIMINFVDQNDNPVDAQSTTSQNLSKFSTSSLPYNDAGPTAVDREGSGNNVVVIDTEGGS